MVQDRPVLEGVDGVLVAHGFLVETAILPDGVVLSPDRWGLRAVHVPLGVLAGRAHVVGLWTPLGGSLAAFWWAFTITNAAKSAIEVAAITKR